MDLLTRLTTASISYPFLLLMLGLATPLRVDDPASYWKAVLAMTLAVSIRAFLFLKRNQLYSRGRPWILVPLLLSMVLSTGTSGLLLLTIMQSYGLSNWTFTVILMWIVGIAAGSTVSFTPSFSLLSVQLALLFAPALLYEWFAHAPHGLSFGFATLAFVGFLFIQGHRLHRMHWDLLTDRAIELHRARELEAAKAASEKAQVQLRYQATHDILTGVMNRAEMLRVCGQEINRALRLGTPLGLLMIDLDQFKQVNDRFGHLCGDDVLRSVTESVACNLRPYDALGRYGGEEFLVILPASDIEHCAAAAERIRVAIESRPVQLQETLARVTASFGVTVLDPRTDTDQRQIIARADTALYQAKRNGRNCVAVQLPRSSPVCLLSAGDQAGAENSSSIAES